MKHEEWVKTLPKKVIGAHGLIINPNEEILLVKTHRFSYWDIPGGIVEANESPSTGCIREVFEEVGVKCKILNCICIDYADQSLSEPEYIIFYFHISPLNQNDITNIIIDSSEIENYGFYSLNRAYELMGDKITNRIKSCLGDSLFPLLSYLENGTTFN